MTPRTLVLSGVCLVSAALASAGAVVPDVAHSGPLAIATLATIVPAADGATGAEPTRRTTTRAENAAPGTGRALVDSDADGEADGEADRGGEFSIDSLPPTELITKAGVEAIERGLAYLASQQSENGAFERTTRSSFTVAFTALAGLAFVAGGYLPGRGQYGTVVQGVLDYLLRQQKDTGFISGPNDGSRIHGHGYATLFFASVYGMIRDPQLEDRLYRALRKAVRIVESSQTANGGWGYEPRDDQFDEGSTTVTQIQALRAARDAGIAVDRRVIVKAIEYVHRCAVRSPWRDLDGSEHIGYTFKYSLGMSASRQTFPLTAAACSTFHGAGRYVDEVLEGGLGWLHGYFHNNMRGTVAGGNWYSQFFFYSHFYAAQAFFHARERRYWNLYFPAVRDALVQRQHRANGAWPSSYDYVYGTAVATLVLQIPYRYLPFFQRQD